MLSRQEYEDLQVASSESMAADRGLQDAARDVLVRADRYRWIHQTTWFGEPAIQLPQDLFAIQDIIYRTRPKYVIEVGVAWGGSLLFNSTLLEVLGGERVIGIDVYIPPDLEQRLLSHGKISDRITLIRGSSTEQGTFERVKTILGGCGEVLIHLDSNHTHEHVLKELRLYSNLVSKGYYMICGDTLVEHIPAQTHRPRPWGPGNNPWTALQAFLKETDRFEVDRRLDAKLLLSCNPGGYLVCKRNHAEK